MPAEPEAGLAVAGAEEHRTHANSNNHSNNASSGSGHSTPRGYPPRNKPFQASQPPPPRGGGLGFHSGTSSKPAYNPYSGQSQSEAPRTTRGTSDPRLWIPVKFVKATALTDKTLENPPKVDEGADLMNPPEQQHKAESHKTLPALEKIEPPPPEILPEPAPASPSDRLWEIEEVTPASVEQWQTDFPGIFKKESPVAVFQPLRSTAQQTDSPLPSNPPQPAISSENESSSAQRAPLTKGESQTKSPTPNSGESPKAHGIANAPQSMPVQPKESSTEAASETVQVTPSTSDIQPSRPALATEPSTDSGALFFIDAEGDSSNRVTYPSAPVAKQRSIEKETDDDEERIVFRPDQSVSMASKADDSHLFRTITDEVHVAVSSDQAAPTPDPTRAKTLSSKPSKKDIKARKRQARKERRRDAHDDRPVDPANHRPDDVDSGSDIDWGSDSGEEEASADKDAPNASSKVQRGVYKNKQEQELCEDYIKNAMMAERASGDEADPQNSASKFLADSFTKTFLDGMDAQTKHTTIDELTQAATDQIDDDILRDQRGWASDRSDSLDDKIDALDLHISDSDQDSAESGSDDDSAEDEDIDETSLDKSLEMSTDLSTESSDDSADEEEAAALVEEVKDPKGKRKEKKDSDGELIEFIDDLQKKWKMDRVRKAARRKERAEARLLSVTKTKKQKKKEARKESSEPPPDVPKLNEMIRDFICFRTEEQVLSLPPVDKRSRAAVHEIAHLYKMKSQSRGKGQHRYPVLTRTHRTTHILRSRQPLFQILNRFTDPGGHRVSAANLVPRNREGALVGQGVKHIGAENVGFKLLTKMGWSLGQTIGDPQNASALQKPIMAVMKNTKGGLGLSSQFRNYQG
ncbi:hypothetical protein PtB15_1B543 [Puccinia triticina]|nr:hypothetical protein PtB15_1B543 [Puccinia triticina]